MWPARGGGNAPQGIFVLSAPGGGGGRSAQTLEPEPGDDGGGSDRAQPPRRERARLDRFNRRLLSRLGGSELGPPSLETSWWRRAEVAETSRRAGALFGAAYGGYSYVWEDACNCILLPFWREALAVPPAAVLVYRHPDDVAHELALARGLPRAMSLAVWERYMRTAIGGLARLEVRIDRAAGGGRFATPAVDERKGPDEPLFSGSAMATEPQLSIPQRELLSALDALTGAHAVFRPPRLPPESEWTEPVLAERRRADLLHRQLNGQLRAVTRQKRAIGRLAAEGYRGTSGAARPHRAARRLRRTVARTAPGPSGGLPDFLVIGGQKCGTTSLFGTLGRSPGTRLPSKELHFFDGRFDRGLDWYRAHFPPPARRAPWRRRRPITGEASPYYMAHPLAPQRVKDVVPDVRLVALVRNPVTRAVSHYYHEVANGNEELPLAQALSLEEERLAGEEERLAAEPGYRSFPHRHFSYQARGRYFDQLTAWLSLFPREQLLVIGSERLFDEPRAQLRRVYDFLGVPGEPVAMRSLNRRDYPSIPAAVERGLAAHFVEPNARLYELVGEDFGW